MKDFVLTFRGRNLTDAPPPDVARVEPVGFLFSDGQAGRSGWQSRPTPPRAVKFQNSNR